MTNIHRISYLLFVCFSMALFSCSSFTAVDKPLQQWTKEHDRYAIKKAMTDRSKDLLVMVAFSGGGTRAAAFSYGVLKELEETGVATKMGRRSLLDEIDIISSVSGGSFTAAYFGLHGKGIFDDYEERFLRKNVQGGLITRLLNPFYWVMRMSPSYSKANLVTEYYDKYIFYNATFGDFARESAPFIVINSTDLAVGSRFAFTQPMFDLICSDLSSYPVSSAVAASSAVPVLFSPITLKNYAGQCGYEPPEWLAEAAQDDGMTSRKMEGRTLEGYLDRENRPWLHLVDGGISDNLGLRAFFEPLALVGDPKRSFESFLHPDPRQILIIAVNAQTKEKTDWALKRYAPSLTEILGAVTSSQMTRYSTDTIDIVRYAYKNLVTQVSTPEHPVEFNFVEVNFDSVKDDAERKYLNTIGTNFHLSDKDVDELISSARKILREDSEFKAFLDRNWADHEDRGNQ